MGERSICVRYSEAVESFVDFARTLTPDEWAMPVPCTPLWTARDLLSHVAGVPDDGLAGRVDGAATEPWTQSQVERNAEFGVDDLLERLLAQYEAFGSALDHIGEERPPYDCHSHEHDLRHAVGRPGNRQSAIVEDAMGLLATWSDLPIQLNLDFTDGSAQTMGSAGADRRVGLATSKFEVFRSRLGRRTPEQVRSLAWTGDDAEIDAVVAGWFAFGPSEIAIDE